MNPISFDPSRTALVLIDLQHSNVARELAPHSAQQVLDHSVQLAAAMRRRGGTVVYVRVLVKELLHLPADVALSRPPSAPPLPENAAELVPQAGYQPGDIVIAKRQWGAFQGTDLDQQLRRRGIGTIILTGIATNFGIESTARAAADQGYAVIFAEDAMTSLRADLHEFSIKNVFPFIGKVRSSADLTAFLASDAA
ncbi:isochorismatase family protein [Janthinobacterium agaricidamnosum]|uniref:Isochorismatase family protein n=1 Tax=Janthinobacterium agaricidamnosum NBRC 102515 = DSM 9628 TaxID=1349767 RepID=W0V9A9_9BURK|nr:isochorismatase family protein [Janthinobacterium agaricidamnosum]CDG83872.1 isochorismatase family protein [Janthinobacterium agaricidamnosum NBRC 102515 = DSM 9628]